MSEREPPLGELIRAKREREGLSLRDAGEASGVAFSTLGRIERGGEAIPRVVRRIEAWLRGEATPLPPPPMTLRDWFAGQALGGLLSDSDNIARHHRLLEGNPKADLRSVASVFAYQYADAMLAERRKTP